MTELMGLVLSALACVLMAVCDLFGFMSGVAEKMNESSRVGESPMERQLRERRRRWYEAVFIVIVLLALAGWWFSSR